MKANMKGTAMKNGRMATPPTSAGWMVLAAVLAAGLTGCGRAPKAGDVKAITLPGGAKMEMVWCPPGTFLMGSPDGERHRGGYETQHQVTLTKGFWLARTEVTQAQWRSVMGNNPSEHRGEDLPVEQVSWDDCVEFCQKAGMRLPTEAEWEYACRGGSTGPYAGSGHLEDMGWYDDNTRYEPHPVGRKSPNGWGLFDMHGNVAEWCGDWQDNYPRGSVTNPVGPDNGRVRCVRGGYYNSDEGDCRSACRDFATPFTRLPAVGFRPVFSGKAAAKANPGAEGKKKAGKTTLRQRLGGIADTKGKGMKMKLYGMFGTPFGKVMPESAACTTNKIGERVYTYRPKKPLDGFGEYVLFATPLTRKVYAVKALHVDQYASSAEDQQFFTKTSELLEERFGATLVRTTSAASDFKFANGRVVSAALAHGIVSITARDAELQKLAKREFEELEARLLAEDVRVLALRPEKQGNEALGELNSVFGVVFGEPCRWGNNPVENNSRAWVYEFEPEGAFMECSDFYVFATSKSKRVFMVRAVFDGSTPELIEDDSDNPEEDAAQAKYDQMRRLLERLVGRQFKDTGSKEYDKLCRMNIGDHFYILLCKTRTSEKVMLDFCSRDMGALNDQEAAERNSDDLFGSANRGLQGLGGF